MENQEKQLPAEVYDAISALIKFLEDTENKYLEEKNENS